MNGFSYKINYFACGLSLFAALISAMTHQLGFLLINFFFAVWNWYIAEYKRGLENEKNDNHESDDSDSTSSTEDDTEDKE